MILERLGMSDLDVVRVGAVARLRPSVEWRLVTSHLAASVRWE